MRRSQIAPVSKKWAKENRKRKKLTDKPTWRDGNPWGNRVPENGTRCRTKAVLGGTAGFLVHPKHMEARVPETLGMIEGWVPGHGGDVWIVRHREGPGDADPSPIAVYGFWELEEIIADKEGQR